MSTYDFWYEDARLFECYVKAYNNRIDKLAWLNGLYVYEAVSASINNIMPSAIGKAFSKNAKVKPMQYSNRPLGQKKENTEKQAQIETNVGAFWNKRIKQLKGMS